MSIYRFATHAENAVMGSGGLALTDAATAVRLTSTTTPIKYVDVCTNGGLANIGSSDADATTGSEVGVTIYPGNLPYRVYADDLKKVWAAGASGVRVSWTFYV